MADDGLAQAIHDADPAGCLSEKGWEGHEECVKDSFRSMARAATAYFWGEHHKGVPAQDSGKGLVEAVEALLHSFDNCNHSLPIGTLWMRIDDLRDALRLAGEEVT